MLHMDRAEQAKSAMVVRLKAAQAFSDPEVEKAFLKVPRHLFLPQVDPWSAYEDHAVMVKFDRRGRPLSSASQPTMVAAMLAQLRIEPGNRVLEIGTGTGYNAALIAELVGEAGSVVSVEVDGDLARTAREHLSRSGFERVEVVIADGKGGFAPKAPYDRIIVTAGAHEIADAWAAQLIDGGRLVVPVVDRSGCGLSTAYQKSGEQLRMLDQIPCAFLLLRDS